MEAGIMKHSQYLTLSKNNGLEVNQKLTFIGVDSLQALMNPKQVK